MKFLQVGLGSMGKRRIRNLLHLGVDSNDIAGFDLSTERTTEIAKTYNILTDNNFERIDSTFIPDAYIISTPPHIHASYFLHAARKKRHFFVEVATTDDGYNELYPLLDKTFVAAPSFTFRYNSAVIKLKQLVNNGAIGRVWAFNHHLGQYLPDWHPWEDYRSFYVSKKESSACREMVPYELQWIQWVLDDDVSLAKGLTAKCSDLDISIDDTYTALLQTSRGIVGTIMVDIIARPAVRVFRLLGSLGTLEWDWQRYTIRHYDAKLGSWKTFRLKKGTQLTEYKTTTEEMYNGEIADFLAAVEGKKEYPYSFAMDQKNFLLLKQIEK